MSSGNADVAFVSDCGNDNHCVAGYTRNVRIYYVTTFSLPDWYRYQKALLIGKMPPLVSDSMKVVNATEKQWRSLLLCLQ